MPAEAVPLINCDNKGVDEWQQHAMSRWWQGQATSAIPVPSPFVVLMPRTVMLTFRRTIYLRRVSGAYRNFRTEMGPRSSIGYNTVLGIPK